MKPKLFILMASILLMLMSCSSNESSTPEYTDLGSDYAPAPAMVQEEAVELSLPVEAKTGAVSRNSTEDIKKVQSGPKKIIKDGIMRVKSQDIKESKLRLDSTLKTLNAYYETEELLNNDRETSYNLRIRVKAGSFEQLIESIEVGGDEIIQKNVQTRDVTEEYMDIETRLANKKSYLKRYKDLLGKANTIKDILAIEDEIRPLQEEIESQEGRLRYLSDQVDFSTLHLTLFTLKEYIYKPPVQDNFWERVKTALSDGWAAVVEFVLWTIAIWPFILLIILIYLIYKRWRKRKKV